MPVHVQKLSSDLTFSEGDLPMDERQIEQLVAKVVEKLDVLKKDKKESSAATSLRSEATPPMTGEGDA